MENIRLSLDSEEYLEKPSSNQASGINNRIGKSAVELEADVAGIEKLVDGVGNKGRAFCPATFYEGWRSKDHFEQQRLFALDFDNKDPAKKVTFDDIKERADRYELPVLFAYDTFSSVDHDKFRVVFLNDISIPNRQVAETMQLALGTVFPEADPACYKDVSRIYYGGKGCIYYDSVFPTINVDTVFRSLTYHFEDKSRKHLKENLSSFSRKSGIALNKNGFLDVTVTENAAERRQKKTGASDVSKNGDFSPSTIMYEIPNGEISPKLYYQISLTDCTRNSSVRTSGDSADVLQKRYKNHGSYRSSILPEISKKCRLFNEFENGTRDMEHNELFGILTNLLNVETGLTMFRNIMSRYPEIYDKDRLKRWADDSRYVKNHDYKPFSCDGYCPYRNDCTHAKNILSTVRPKRWRMERLPEQDETFYSIEEAQDDVFTAISAALDARNDDIYVVRGQVGIGKSSSYLRLISENPTSRFLVAAPTNLLKDELYNKAKGMGIEVKRTPSLEQIKDEIPEDVWSHIQKLYGNGQHRHVHSYIRKVLETDHIPCLEKYMEKREELKKYRGTIITTHRYLLNMEEKRLKEFDAVIVDEDILFKSVIANQEEISVSRLNKILKKKTSKKIRNKINQLLDAAENQTCIELGGFELDDDDGANYHFDMTSFCLAEHFFLRKESVEKGLKEDTVVFLKPVSFKSIKYIIVSATADKEIYEQFFANRTVHFCECKKARYMGRLNQYPAKSMSRTCVDNNPGIIEKLMNHFGVSEEQVITFMKENIGSLHFGNTEGSNALEGKDILVAGTPYHADFLYKLVAFTLGFDFDEDEKMTLQTVTHNGYRFRFTTFVNEGLRNVQFWMIESELEQAVGRARLLRHDCDVHLFSNFPLNQSEMITDFNFDNL